MSLQSQSSIGPIGFTLEGMDQEGNANYTVTVPLNAAKGCYQWHINAIRDGRTVGRIVATISVMNPSETPQTKAGIIDLLQVGREDFVQVS